MTLKNGLMIILTTCFLTTAINTAAMSNDSEDLNEFINQAMAASNTPGLAVSIVHGDELVIAQGYGVREAGKDELVDKDTLFAIGSNSKHFTATALGLLVDESTLSWDEPLTRYLPTLRFSVPYLFTELTLRDALSHRTGLQRADMAWYANPGISRDEVLAMIDKLSLEQSFRSGFLYNNFMFLAAGQTIPAVTGLSWDEYVHDKIFEPLQMNRSVTSIHDLDQMDNVATPHTMLNGKAIPIPYYDTDHIAPAGSISSSVADMAQWCRVQLGDGQFAGQQVIPKAVIDEVRKPHNLFPLRNEGHVRTVHGAYALGIGRVNYGPERVAYMHTGGIDGMLSSFAFVPESQLCVVVLTNSTTNYGLHKAVMNWILDHELGMAEIDYVAKFNEELKKYREEEEEIVRKRVESHDPSLGASLPLDTYAGTYSNNIYGDFVIVYKNKELRFSYGSLFHGRLVHHRNDSFDLLYDEAIRNASEPAVVDFGLDASGEVESVLLEMIGEQIVKIRFTVKPDKTS